MGVTPYVILYLIPALTSAALAVYSWRRRQHEGARPFSLLLLAIAFWSFCHSLSVGAATFDRALFWAQVQYGGIVLVSPLWLLFALAYANQWHRVTARMILLLLIPAALAYAAVLTNSWHQLWWPSVTLDPSRPFVALSVTRGILFWLHAIYSYGCVLAGLGLFVHTMLESQLVYRTQARLVVLGALMPIVGNVAHLLGLQLRAIDDPTPFLFGASTVLMFLASQRYHLLDLAPIAQHEIFEGMPDGVVVLDRREVVAALNQAAAQLLEIDPATWVGCSARMVADSSPLAAALCALIDASVTPASRSVTFAGADGPRIVEVRLRPLLARSRTRVGLLLLLRDMTERSRMEQVLDRHLAELTLLNQIARAANAAAQTDDLLRMIAGEIMCTMAWDRVTIGIMQPDGASLRLAIDQSLHGTPSIEGRFVGGPEFAHILDTLQSGETRALNVADPSIAGTPTEAAMRQLALETMLVIPLYRRAEPLGILFVGHTRAQSISADALRLYETIGGLVSEAMTRAGLYEEAQQASTLKSTFIATMSHELRTPLTSIIGYTDMLQHGIFGQLPEQTVEPLTYIRRSGKTLLNIINDILDFSKMEAGHFTVDRYPVDLTAVIRGVVGTLQPQVYERGLRLSLEIAPDLPLVYGNTTRLEQVLTNLLANAIKFTDHGTITVRAAQDNDQVRLSVQDTGIGIAPEDQRRLFQPFHQIENQDTRRFGGAGLGLAISRRLVELMDGSLSLESTPGAGTTFYCDLRVAPAGVLKEATIER